HGARERLSRDAGDRARWQRLPNSAYGVGQVYSALPDIKMLQSMWRLDLGAGELAVAGMWIAEDDGVLNPRTIKIGPRKVI
ncbi:portal protein, partial [Helicobacter pylori]|uniref:portal protein n=1 Tax=Helicobacter pylori TaxID=210 RepID=UPI00292784FF